MHSYVGKFYFFFVKNGCYSITPLEEHGRGHGWNNHYLCVVIRGRVACGRIENRRRKQERVEQEQRDERDYDYYGPYYDQPHRQRSPEGRQNLGGFKAFSRDLNRVHLPLKFKMSGIEKCHGSTNPAEWLKVYQLAIEATRGDSYIMKKYLPICLLLSARTRLLGLPAGSVRSYNHLCRLFTSNLHAMCPCPGVD
jgi:hypothetical protein